MLSGSEAADTISADLAKREFARAGPNQLPVPPTSPSTAPEKATVYCAAVLHTCPTRYSRRIVGMVDRLLAVSGVGDERVGYGDRLPEGGRRRGGHGDPLRQ